MATSQPPESDALARTLDEWLRLAGGNLPGDFLRMHGLNPVGLVSEGLLSRAEGRWSDSYVAGLRLDAVQKRTAPRRI